MNQNLECTPQIYDNEFSATYNMVPSGGSTYANVSLEVPQRIAASEARIGNNLYNITYSEVIVAGNRKFAVIQYNLSGSYVTASTFTGDFGGSYSAVLENYTTFNTTTDKCALFGV